jgi:CRP/FNR family transcriptional regulator, cyclic AMP receptor protein
MVDELPPELEALRRVPFFEDLTSDDLRRIATVGRRKSFDAGDAIVERGGDDPGLYVLISGSATVDAGGRTHTLRPGDFVGEMSLLAGRPRSATVTAAEPVEALVITTMYFKPFLMANPSVAVHILEVVAERLRRVQDELEGEGDDG